MADTKITNLRNLMTPIVNYFALLGRLNSDDTEIEEFNKLIKLLHKENDNVDSVIWKIRKILAEIPEDACERKPLETSYEKCNLASIKSSVLPEGYLVYKCAECGAVNVKRNNGEIRVGFCDECDHPLWND